MQRLANNVITGIDRNLNLYYYYSPFSGRNIVRRCSSLTGERVKKDAAFKGFRESGNRMKEASPIAAALYKMVPSEIKQYSLYRLLTGEALKMLKAGDDPATITETLKQIHIDPLLQEPLRERVHIERTRRANRGNIQSLSDITRYFPIRSADKSKIRRWRRHYSERLIINLPVTGGNLQHTGSNLLEKNIISESSEHQISILKNVDSGTHQPTPIPKTKYPELIYRGRLRECKKLKLWIRSSMFPGAEN